MSFVPEQALALVNERFVIQGRCFNFFFSFESVNNSVVLKHVQIQLKFKRFAIFVPRRTDSYLLCEKM